jgi:hypothetical protein
METLRVRCVWETWLCAPYFSNLKVMRLALDAVRGAVEGAGGALRVYVFLDDRMSFVAEGPATGLRGALERARTSAESEFRASDRKSLWGNQADEPVTCLGREEAVSPLLRMPVEAGLVSDAADYPWIGGDWAFLER